MQRYHDNAGHFALRETLNNIKRHHWWDGMAKDVEAYVKGCEVCQKIRPWGPRSKRHGHFHSIQEQYNGIFQCVGMDMIELKRTPSGNRYALVLCDYFSKWIDVIPMKKATAHEVRSAIGKWIAYAGVPESIISDLGSNFTAKELQWFLDDTGIRHFTALAQRQSTNGMVESHIKILKRILKSLQYEKRQSWDTLLDEVKILMRTRVHGTTGMSPYEVAWGVPPRVPYYYFNDSKVSDNGDVPMYVQKHQIVRKYVLDHIEFNVQKQRQYYNQNCKEIVFGIGDMVLWRKNQGKLQRPKMLGPYRISKLLPPRDLELYDTTNDKFFVVHEEDVFPYQSRSVQLPSPQSDRRDIVFTPPEYRPPAQQQGPQGHRDRASGRGMVRLPQLWPRHDRDEYSYYSETDEPSWRGPGIKQEPPILSREVKSEGLPASLKRVTFDLRQGTTSADSSPAGTPRGSLHSSGEMSGLGDGVRTRYGRRVRPPTEFWKTQG